MSDMTLWERIQGHRDTVDFLRQIINNKKLSHAYLFQGPGGVGKALAAQIFASALFCDDACGSCHECHAVQSHTHPDFYYVAPEGSRTILRDQIMKLLKWVNLKRQRADFKVAVIDEAQTLGPEAANALLKTLEEPPPGVIFILVASNDGRVLPTVASRCQRILFHPLDDATVTGLLEKEYGIEPQKAEVAARLAQGMVGEAVDIASADLLDYRAELAGALFSDQPRAKASAELSSRMVALAGARVKTLKAEHVAELTRFEEISGGGAKIPAGVKRRLTDRHKRELARTERRCYHQILVLIASLYRDLLLINENADKKFIANLDMIGDRAFAAAVNETTAQRALSEVEKARRRIDQNVNPVLAFENLFFSV